MRAVGARLLRVGSSSSPHASADPADCARDLRKLAMLAVPMGVRIGYQGLAEGCHVRDFGSAWDLVFRADVPNLGLVLDSFDVLSGTLAAEEIEMLDPSKVFLVRLCDLLWPGTAPGSQVRVLPGEGSHRAALAGLMRRLDRLGYRGNFSFAFDNADDRQLPPTGVAERGRRAALWLAEDVLQLSTPLPGRMRLHRR